MRRAVLASSFLVVALLVLAGGGWSTAVAQEGTPVSTPPPTVGLTLRDVQGNIVGSATFSQADDGTVTVIITGEGLPPGEHGVHVHETGVCDPSGSEPFSSAGGHFNPTGMMHGAPETPGTSTGEPAGTPSPVASPMAMASPMAGGAHAGDLGNLYVDQQGNVRFQITTDRFTLSSGPTSLNDADGSALVIHADRDDLTSQPSGNSGPRIACGVIFPPMGGTPTASPAASPAA